jgi:hypothetical protein
VRVPDRVLVRGDTVFAGTLTSWAEPCVLASGGQPTQEQWTPTWLESAVTYAPQGQGWELYDAAGAPVATLSPGAPLPQAERPGDPSAITPVVTPELRTALAPEPLPGGLVPVTEESLVGRWVPAEGSFESEPHAEFRADGHWSASEAATATSAGGRLRMAGDSSRRHQLGSPSSAAREHRFRTGSSTPPVPASTTASSCSSTPPGPKWHASCGTDHVPGSGLRPSLP